MLILGFLLVGIGIMRIFFPDFFQKIFTLKYLEKIVILSLLFAVIYIVFSIGSYRIANYLSLPKHLTPTLYWRLMFMKDIQRNSSLNNIYLQTTSMLCLGTIPFLFYMLKVRGNQLDTHGTARWAKIWEWDEAGFLAPPGEYKEGVILGRTKEKFFGLIPSRCIIDNEKTHIAVVAPTRSGKGVGIIIPTLLNWLGSVFVMDMKGENFQITAGYRKKVLKQKILKFKPYGLEDSVSYNPLGEVRIGTPYEVKDATIIADILTDPGEGKKRDHWDTSASTLFVGLILHVLYVAKKEGRVASFGDIVDFLTSTDDTLENNFLKLLQYSHLDNSDVFRKIYEESQMRGVKEGTHPLVARTAAEILNKDERERASVISTVMAKLTLFKDPIIRKNTSRVDFRIQDFMDYHTPVSFYIVVEAEQMDTLAPLLRILVTQTIGLLAPEMDFSSDAPPHKHRLLFMMDEFPAFGTIPLFEKALAYIAGYGMKAVVIAQALNQIKKNYGDKNSVFDNCATAVFYAPSPLDNETPRQISDLLGETTIKIKNRSYKALQIIGDNISESNQARKLLTPEEVRNKLGDKRNIVSIAGHYPMMGVKVRYYLEEYFTSKTNKNYGIPKTDYLYQKEEKRNLQKEQEEMKMKDIMKTLEETENIEIDEPAIQEMEEILSSNLEEREAMLHTLEEENVEIIE